MCGIVAVYSHREPISPASLERATKSLWHRGPDSQQKWVSRDGRVGLGHARLSIIDLSTGDQPIASEDNRTHIVANGEFYGYEAIQKELEGRGHRLRTRSDSEIALPTAVGHRHSRPTQGARSAQPVALPVEQIGALRLHPATGWRWGTRWKAAFRFSIIMLWSASARSR